MNQDILKGKWKQLRGEVKSRWGKLTDDELDLAAGSYDKLVGQIQERYGYARDQAEEELDEFLEGFEDDTEHGEAPATYRPGH